MKMGRSMVAFVALAALAGLAADAIGPDETAAIQRRIDDCFRAGGGRVSIAPGVHRIGGIRLRSRVELHLESGAVLQASREPGAFDDVMRGDRLEPVEETFFTEPAPPFAGRKPTRSNVVGSRWNNAIIRVYRAKDVSITGEPGSVIDGCNSYDPEGEEDFRGVHGISVVSCENLTLSGYTLKRTGNWGHRIMDARNVKVTGLTVLGGHDGMDFHGCKDVEIRKCTIHSGDDCIAGVLNEGVHVLDCDLSSSCSDFRLGGNGIVIEKCRAHGPCEWPWRYAFPLEAKRDGVDHVPGYKRYNTLSFFTHFGSALDTRPGDVVVRDCTVWNVDKLLHFNRSGNERWQHGPGLGRIEFQNVQVSGLVSPLVAYGVTDTPISIVAKDCGISFREKPEAFLRGANVKEIRFENVTVLGVDAPFFLKWGDLVPEIEVQNYTGPKPEATAAGGAFKCQPI